MAFHSKTTPEEKKEIRRLRNKRYFLKKQKEKEARTVKTVITVVITHDQPKIIDFLKTMILQLVRKHINSEQIAIWHENQ